LPDGPLQPALSSGEVLCDLINKLRPGLVPRVAREAATAAMPESKRNAKLRENIGQYVDACAELGLPQRELFTTPDLFEGKNFGGVLKNIEGIARFAQGCLPEYEGPLIGKKLHYKKEGHSAATRGPAQRGYQQVVLSRGGYMPQVGGRGNM